MFTIIFAYSRPQYSLTNKKEGEKKQENEGEKATVKNIRGIEYGKESEEGSTYPLQSLPRSE